MVRSIQIHKNSLKVKNELDAKRVGSSVANSPLLKQQWLDLMQIGEEFVMAIGKSGVNIDPQKLSIKFGDFILLKNGEKSPSCNLNNIDKYLQKEKIEITINLGIGKKFWIMNTCDFTKRYISINTDYRS